ncbi:hypothetical protein EDC32_101372 [Laceyella sacchari]|nr:hypothetical protein EDC32_101372 [Laceyella sacchari]
MHAPKPRRDDADGSDSICLPNGSLFVEHFSLDRKGDDLLPVGAGCARFPNDGCVTLFFRLARRCLLLCFIHFYHSRGQGRGTPPATLGKGGNPTLWSGIC